MVVKVVRVVLITLFLLTLVAQFDVPTAQAQKGSLLLRGLGSAYRQTNQPGSNCSRAFTPNWDPPSRPEQPIEASLGGSGRPTYTYGDGVFTTWDNLTGEVGGRLKRAPGNIPLRGTLAQNDHQPITVIDPDTGRTLTIDDRGHATLSDAGGANASEFDVFLNYFGEPVVNIQGKDDRVQRMSIDGYTAEISPDGEHCALCDALETYDLELDEDGAWMFTDDDGYTVWLEEDEDGTIYTSDSDGLEGVYYEDGSFEIYDENDELVESGDLENLTLEERADELGFDLDGDENFFEFAFDQSGFEEIPEDEIVASEIMEDDTSLDDASDDQSIDDAADDQGADDAGDEESLDDAADDQSADDTDNQDSADDADSDEAPADDAEGG